MAFPDIDVVSKKKEEEEKEIYYKGKSYFTFAKLFTMRKRKLSLNWKFFHLVSLIGHHNKIIEGRDIYKIGLIC